MTFEQYVDEVFKDHHDCSGLDSEEIEELMEESTWETRYKWLVKNGYDLDGEYGRQY